MGEWGHGLCGCFDNCGLCLFAYFCPCVVFGQAAESVGESCGTCGCCLMVPIGNIFAWQKVRGKIRESRNIDGTACNDFLMLLFCQLCGIVQMAQETRSSESPSDQNMPRV